QRDHHGVDAYGHGEHATPAGNVSAHRQSGVQKTSPRSRKLRSRLDKDRSRRGCIMKRATFLLVGAAVALGFGVAAASAQTLKAAAQTLKAAAQTLKAVKDRGSLICGVRQGLPGVSTPAGKGNWTGFDVDFCRALAAAILNDPTKVKFTPLSAKDRFEPLKTGDIDLLSRNTTWTLARDVSYGNFAGVTYYDG